MPEHKPQTNLRLSAERRERLEAAARVEGRDKAEIVEEALRFREELMGSEYQHLLDAALKLRYQPNPEDVVAAIATLRNEAPGATDATTMVSGVRARLRARAAVPA